MLNLYSYIRNIRQQRENREIINKLFRCLSISFDLKRKYGTASPGQVFLIKRMGRFTLQGRMMHCLHLRVRCQPGCDLQRVFHMPLHPQRERLQTLEQKE